MTKYKSGDSRGELDYEHERQKSGVLKRKDGSEASTTLNIKRKSLRSSENSPISASRGAPCRWQSSQTVRTARWRRRRPWACRERWTGHWRSAGCRGPTWTSTTDPPTARPCLSPEGAEPQKRKSVNENRKRKIEKTMVMKKKKGWKLLVSDSLSKWLRLYYLQNGWKCTIIFIFGKTKTWNTLL